MLNFDYYNPAKIIFGKDTEKRVGEEIRKYSSKALFVHYGDGVIEKIGLYDKVVNSLREAHVAFTELKGVKPNPVLSLVQEGIRLCRENDIGFLLAVGGGSVIDTCKAIAAGVPYKGNVWDFYLEKAVPEQALPVGVILTIPAAGSEVSPDSVITDETTHYKTHLTSDLIRTKFNIMNPENTFSVPPYQTASGAADIMAHVIERYFTQEKNVELTDRLGEATLKTVINNLPIVLKEPKNYAARAEVMWAGSIAHNNILATGRTGDWASHMIQHEVTAINDMAHGAGMCIILPAWMKYVYKHGLHKFVQFAVRVWGIEQDFDNPEETALKGIQEYMDFNKSIGMPSTLKEAGIKKEDFAKMAERCRMLNDDGTVGNFVRLLKEDILKILEIAYE